MLHFSAPVAVPTMIDTLRTIWPDMKSYHHKVLYSLYSKADLLCN